jgi:hypothetical protein
LRGQGSNTGVIGHTVPVEQTNSIARSEPQNVPYVLNVSAVNSRFSALKLFGIDKK